MHAGVAGKVSVLNIDSLMLMHYPVKADLYFIDGNHEHMSVKTDFELARINIMPGGIILMHDIYLKSVRTVIDQSGLETVQRVGSLEAVKVVK